jgi:hypothetical protein
MTSDSPSSRGHVRTAFIESLIPALVTVAVAVLAWFGWTYFLDPADGDPTNAKTLVYAVVLVVVVWLAAFLTRAPWVGLLAPFAMAHAIVWGAAQDVVNNSGLEVVSAEALAWGGFIAAAIVGALGVLPRVRGNFWQILRGRDAVAIGACVVVGRVLMALAP